MVGWHHGLYGHEFEQALGDDKGQGSLACRSPWGLPDPGIEHGSPALQADSLLSEPPGKAKMYSVQFSRSVVSDSL